MDVIKQLFHGIRKRFHGNDIFFVSVSSYKDDLLVFYIFRTDLKPYGNALHLPLIEFPACGLIGIVHLNANAGALKLSVDFVGLLNDSRFVHCNGEYNELNRRNARGQNKTAVIAVNHYKATDHARGCSP